MLSLRVTDKAWQPAKEACVVTSAYKIQSCVLRKAGKVIIVFFDVRDTILIELQEQGETINRDVYCEKLRRPHQSIKSKQRRLLKEGEILPHDSMFPHVSNVKQNVMVSLKW